MQPDDATPTDSRASTVVTLQPMEVTQVTDAEDARSARAEALREELRQQFPAEAGYVVAEATWVELVDGEADFIPVTVVKGNGIDLTFFPRAPRNPWGAR